MNDGIKNKAVSVEDIEKYLEKGLFWDGLIIKKKALQKEE